MSDNKKNCYLFVHFREKSTPDGEQDYFGIIEEGDIVKIDVGAYIHGFHGDSANTFPCGNVSEEAKKLIAVTKRSWELGAEAAGKEGARIGDIGAAVDGYVVANGFSTVKKYVGHGVGEDLHEDPNELTWS